MALLEEFAITPDILDIAGYEDAGACKGALQKLKEIVLHSGVVRDLCNGEWSRGLRESGRAAQPACKELLEKLLIQKRLVPFSAEASYSISSDGEWGREAVASHKRIPLDHIIASKKLARVLGSEGVVKSMSQLPPAVTWLDERSSTRPSRTPGAYERELHLILRCANSLLFIDPHLDPSQKRYKEFGPLICRAGGRQPSPLIEIHRIHTEGSGENKKDIAKEEWETRFRDLGRTLAATGLSADVFLWDEFHDRFVITNLVGVCCSNGFDTTTRPGSMATWARLGRNARDEIQKEFDPASRMHKLKHQFKIP